ncbi:MAG: U32 family peptidase, partial [Gemmataceae bacterium]|nr:U32 family peptidase [Gemmataceae bacterium]
RAYLLSPQDLAAYDLIGELVDAGVISFKIEGRLKGGPYVAATTQTYRKALDAKLEARAFALPRRDQLDLAQTFSRGLTAGFLEGVNHQTLVRGRFPKSRGIRLGRVVGFARGGVRVELAEAFDDLVKPGDGVLFDLGRPETQEPGGRVWRASVARGVAELHFEAGALDFGQIPVGCDVYKTDDPALRKRLEQSYAQDRVARRVPVRARLVGTLSGALTLTLSDGSREGHAAWEGPLEPARKQPTSEAEIREQLARLGDTPFELSELTTDLPAGVMLPRSVLNDLRRRAAAALAEGRRPTPPALSLKGRGESAERRLADEEAVSSVPASASEWLVSPLPVGRGAGGVGSSETGGRQSTDEREIGPRLTVLVRSLDQLDAVLAWVPPDGLSRPAAVYCDFEDLRRYKEAVP